MSRHKGWQCTACKAVLCMTWAVHDTPCEGRTLTFMAAAPP